MGKVYVLQREYGAGALLEQPAWSRNGSDSLVRKCEPNPARQTMPEKNHLARY